VKIDTLIHAPVRLRIMSALLPVEHLSFKALKEAVGATDGNLATHVGKLEAAEYVSMSKQFVGRKPQTTYAMTDKGRAAFVAYLDMLSALLPPRS
jgi:predicted ArsR family transcriptional regulator